MHLRSCNAQLVRWIGCTWQDRLHLLFAPPLVQCAVHWRATASLTRNGCRGWAWGRQEAANAGAVADGDKDTPAGELCGGRAREDVGEGAFALSFDCGAVAALRSFRSRTGLAPGSSRSRTRAASSGSCNATHAPLPQGAGRVASWWGSQTVPGERGVGGCRFDELRHIRERERRRLASLVFLLSSGCTSDL